jgi:DNA-binding NarL/FixJ family response regulator
LAPYRRSAKVRSSFDRTFRRVRVLICDDHNLIRAGLRRLVESFDDMVVVAEAASADEAVSRTQASGPDVVLLDLSMPGRSGFDALDELRRVAPDVAVVIMSMHDDTGHVREALARGARGFVVKEAAPAELEIALRAACAGRTFLSPQVSAAVLADAGARTRRSADRSGLPPRQREILAALGAGRTTKQIAADLGISIKTVETHRARLMEALGCRNATELVRTAVQWSGRLVAATPPSGSAEP